MGLLGHKHAFRWGPIGPRALEAATAADFIRLVTGAQDLVLFLKETKFDFN